MVVGASVAVRGFRTHWALAQDCVAAIAQARPDVIVSIGDVPAALQGQPLEVRRRWLHFADTPSPDVLTTVVTATAASNALADRFPDTPLVTVFSALYDTTPAQFERAHESLRRQSWDNWEWVLWDDSPHPVHTAHIAMTTDPRVRYYADRHCGRIGQVKHHAAMFGRGKILVELDHDDELTPNALADIVSAWRDKPGCMYYSDCAEVGPDGENLTYPDGWGFGYGSYRDEAGLAVTNYPPVNTTTLSHITGVPNHVRAWDAVTYRRMGGHNPALAVADDYELILRCYLETQIVHIPTLCYIQHSGGHTTQRRINGDIQEMCRWIWAHYREPVLKRAAELGLDSDSAPAPVAGDEARDQQDHGDDEEPLEALDEEPETAQEQGQQE